MEKVFVILLLIGSGSFVTLFISFVIGEIIVCINDEEWFGAVIAGSLLLFLIGVIGLMVFSYAPL